MTKATTDDANQPSEVASEAAPFWLALPPPGAVDVEAVLLEVLVEDNPPLKAPDEVGTGARVEVSTALVAEREAVAVPSSTVM